MFNANCLLTQPELYNEFKQIVEFVSNEMVAEIGEAHLPDVYRALRTSGLEVDVQTVAQIYREVNDTNNEAYSSDEYIDLVLMGPAQRIVNYHREEIRTIGKNAPATEVATRIIAAIQKVLDSSTATKTVQRQMQDRLIASAKKILSNEAPELFKKVESSIDPYDAIREALVINSDQQFDGLNGMMNNAEVLFNDFKKQLAEIADTLGDDVFAKAEIDLAASIIEESTYDLLLSRTETHNALLKALRDAGFTKVVNGNVSIDWNEARKSGDIETALRGALSKEFSNEQIDIVLPSLIREYQYRLANTIRDKFKDTMTKSGDLEKMAILAAQNQGAFNNAQNNALLKAMGVPAVNISSANQIQRVLNQYGNILKANPLAILSSTFTMSLERHIRNDIEKAVENAGGKFDLLSFQRNFSLFSQYGMGLVLANPGNIPENFLSGAMAGIDTFIQMPKQTWSLIKRGVISGLSVAKGGVRVGAERSNINSTMVNIDDRTSAQYLGLKNWKVWANLFQRVTLSATDALWGQMVMTSVEAKELKLLLKAQGLNNSESNMVINELYFKGVNDGLKNVVAQMGVALNNAGIKGVDADLTRRMLNELVLANLISNGAVFEDLANMLSNSGDPLGAKLSGVDITTDMVLSIRKVADAVRGKAMGHAPDTQIGAFIQKIYDMGLKPKILKSQKEGKRNQQAVAEGASTFLGNVLFARRGALNWAFLNLQRSTGAPLAITILYDLLFKGGVREKYLTKDRMQKIVDAIKNSQTDEDYKKSLAEFQDKLEFTMSVQQRLSREIAGTIFAGMFSSVLWSLMVSKCEDNPDCVANKFKEWLDGGYLSTIEKWLPYVFVNFIHSQFDDRGKIRPDAPKSPGEYLSQTLNITDFDLFLRHYHDYVSKNRMGEDKLFTPLYNIAMPPVKKGTTGFLEEYQVPGYRFAQLGDMIGGAAGLRHLKAYDVWANRIEGYKFLGGGDIDKSPSEKKAERKSMYPVGFTEGVAKSMLTNAMFKWYATEFGHLSEKELASRPTISLRGVGPATQDALSLIGIDKYKDLEGMTPDDIYKMEDTREGKKGKLFSREQSVSIYNEINNKSVGKYEAKSMGFTMDELTSLADMSYYSFDEKNIDEAIDNVGQIYISSNGEKKVKFGSIYTKLQDFKAKIEK